MRKYVQDAGLAALVAILPMFIFSWWIQPIHGDLTRIGKWTERDFGPNALPPAIHVKSNGESLREADVLVLGDSFSVGNLWQSVLSEKTGLVVKSFDYEKNCISKWVAASAVDKSSKIIVMQTVERNLVARFSRMPECQGKNPLLLEVKAGVRDGGRNDWPLTTDPWYLAVSAFNLLVSSVTHEDYSKRFMTVNIALRPACALFSNRRNDRLLYYADDDLKAHWSEQEIQDAVSNILKIQRAVQQSGKRFVFVLAPDKSTVYRGCFAHGREDRLAQDLNERLIAAGVLAPNMTRQFQARINKVTDLYDPDNTHWSRAGYILAGEAMGRYLSGDGPVP